MSDNTRSPEGRDELDNNTDKSQAAPQRNRFAVGLTFPGEFRELVKSVSKLLAETFSQERVLYDEFHSAEFARPNLDTYLQDLYENQTDLIVVFLCEAYEQKEWCSGIEFRVVRTLIKERRSDELMLIRLDDGAVSGIKSIDGALDCRKNRDAEYIATKICERYELLSKTPVKKPPRQAKAKRNSTIKLIVVGVLAVALVAYLMRPNPPVPISLGNYIDDIRIAATSRTSPEFERFLGEKTASDIAVKSFEAVVTSVTPSAGLLELTLLPKNCSQLPDKMDGAILTLDASQLPDNVDASALRPEPHSFVTVQVVARLDNIIWDVDDEDGALFFDCISIEVGERFPCP